jgi:hypothetical protein
MGISMPNTNNLYSMTAVTGYGSFTARATTVTASVDMTLLTIDVVAGDVRLGTDPPPTVTLTTYLWGGTTSPQSSTVNLVRAPSGSPYFIAQFTFPRDRVSPALRAGQTAVVSGTISVYDGNNHPPLTRDSVPISVYFDPGLVVPAAGKSLSKAKRPAKKAAKPKAAPKRAAMVKSKTSKVAKPKRAAKKAAKAKRPAKRPMKKASAKKAKRVVKKASRAKRKAK